MAAIIVPTVLAHDPAEYRNIAERYQSFAKRIQIDIADDTYAPTPTITEENIWWADPNTDIDIHMMVAHPSEHLEQLIKLHPSLVILHAEADENILPSLAKLQENGIKAGVALLKRTVPSMVAPYIEAADHVLIFAGKLGEQGGPADLMQIEKTGLIRAIKSDVEIGWDGGANLENIRALAHNQLDVINVGSALMTAEDPAAMMKELESEADKTGVVI